MDLDDNFGVQYVKEVGEVLNDDENEIQLS